MATKLAVTSKIAKKKRKERNKTKQTLTNSLIICYTDLQPVKERNEQKTTAIKKHTHIQRIWEKLGKQLSLFQKKNAVGNKNMEILVLLHMPWL